MARPTTRLTLLIALVSTLGPYSIDAFFPSLRAIAADLHATPLQAQQILTAFLLPYSLVSLVHGSLSDALGRRRVILVSLFLYVIASVGCGFAGSFSMLLICRALQGTVAGAGHIIGRAVVRDRYSGVQAQRVMSSITMIFAVGPALAPVIGGWIHVLYGWRAVFGTMALAGMLMMLAVWRWMPETHPQHLRTALEFRGLLANVLNVLRNRRFQWLVGSSCMCFMALHAYIGAAPAIVLDHWHLSETQFGALSIPVIGGFAVGAYFSGKLAGRVDPERMIRFGYNGSLAASVLMLGLQLGMPDPPIYIQQLLLASTAAGLQFIFPVVTLRILDLFDSTRGAAASAHACISMLMSTLMMGFVSPLLAVDMWRIALAGLVLNLVGWLIWLIKLRQPLQQ